MRGCLQAARPAPAWGRARPQNPAPPSRRLPCFCRRQGDYVASGMQAPNLGQDRCSDAAPTGGGFRFADNTCGDMSWTRSQSSSREQGVQALPPVAWFHWALWAPGRQAKGPVRKASVLAARFAGPTTGSQPGCTHTGSPSCNINAPRHDGPALEPQQKRRISAAGRVLRQRAHPMLLTGTRERGRGDGDCVPTAATSAACPSAWARRAAPLVQHAGACRTAPHVGARL